MIISPGGRFRAALARLPRDRRGIVAVMVALLIPAFIGLAGLGAETGLWYAMKRQNQSAADEAAISGAMEIVANQTYPDVCALAQYDAARNNFAFVPEFTCPKTTPACTSPAAGTMCANNPPVLGANAGNANAVEVILSQQQGSLFASRYMPNVTIKTRAVATALSTPACLLALYTGPSQTGVTVSGGSSLNMPDCSVISNSTDVGGAGSVAVLGGATLTAQTIIASGTISPTPCNGCTLTTPATIDAAATADPYAARVTSIVLPAAACANGNGVVSPTPYPNPPCYQSLSLSAAAALNPGVYFVDGNLDMSGTVSGTGVTFVIYGNGQITMHPGVNVTLSAPTTGGVPYQGLLFYQVAADNHGASFAGCTVLNCTFTGAIYLPSAPITFSGQSSSNCTVLIAYQINVTGASTLNASQCGADGVTTPSNLTGTVALAE